MIPNNIYAAFVQDSWRLRPNLTMNIGIRYDFESYAGILKDKNNISPRVAVSFDPINTTSMRIGARPTSTRATT